MQGSPRWREGTVMVTREDLNDDRLAAAEADGVAGLIPTDPGRALRLAIVLLAVLSVVILTVLTPRFAQARTQDAAPTASAAVDAEAFAARAASTDRSATRAALPAETPAADATASDAVEERADALAAVNVAIDAEAERLEAARIFAWPTAGDVTSGWGKRFHPILHYTRLHGGADIGGETGAPIYATADGVVTKAARGHNSGSGNNVRIDHGSLEGHAVETAYLHMNDIEVTVGQHVTKGQRIGTVGSTGLSTAPHLHFSLYLDGVNSDPMIYLSKGR